jgi:hypothetical protein
MASGHAKREAGEQRESGQHRDLPDGDGGQLPAQ